MREVWSLRVCIGFGPTEARAKWATGLLDTSFDVGIATKMRRSPDGVAGR
jgi:hypothetical protein